MIGPFRPTSAGLTSLRFERRRAPADLLVILAAAVVVVRQLRALTFTISHRSELSALERVIERGRP